MATTRSLSFWRRICFNLSPPEGAAAFNLSKIDPTPVLLLLPLLLQSPLLLDSAIFFTIRARGGYVIMRLRNFLAPCPYFSSIVLLARASLFFQNFCRQIGRKLCVVNRLKRYTSSVLIPPPTLHCWLPVSPDIVISV